MMMIIIWSNAKDIIKIYLLWYKIHDLLTNIEVLILQKWRFQSID